jgi:hypothetical protein
VDPAIEIGVPDANGVLWVLGSVGAGHSWALSSRATLSSGAAGRPGSVSVIGWGSGGSTGGKVNVPRSGPAGALDGAQGSSENGVVRANGVAVVLTSGVGVTTWGAPVAEGTSRSKPHNGGAEAATTRRIMGALRMQEGPDSPVRVKLVNEEWVIKR